MLQPFGKQNQEPLINLSSSLQEERALGVEEVDPFMVHISPYFTLQQRLHARTPPPTPAPAQPRAGEGEEGGFRVSGPHVPVPGDLTSCRSVAQSCPTLCSPLGCSTPGPLSFTVSQSLLKLTSIESVMPSTHFLLCRPLLCRLLLRAQIQR